MALMTLKKFLCPCLVHETKLTPCDTLTHLLKSVLGTGILAMPLAFRSLGSIPGIFGTLIVSFICSYCAYILVKCAHKLYENDEVVKYELGYPEVAEAACIYGPEWSVKFAKPFKISVRIFLVITYVGICSVYIVIVAEDLHQIVDIYAQKSIDKRYYMAMILLPLLCLSWVPNLKILAPVSFCAVCLISVGLTIIFYYYFEELHSLDTVDYIAEYTLWPRFFSVTTFAIDCIGVVMPLSNSMHEPHRFIGPAGVLPIGMLVSSIIYTAFGFLGYLRYGNDVVGAIILNLSMEEDPARLVKIFYGCAVFCSYGIQFYILLDVVWNILKKYVTKRKLLVNYIVRTLITIFCVIIAIAVPAIGPLTGLIGAFCFSFLGFIFPVWIETIVFWERGFGKCGWRAIINIILFIYGIFMLISGSWVAVLDVIDEYESLANKTHDSPI